MSRDTALQSGPTLLQESDRPLDAARESEQIGYWPLDKPIPALLTPADLRAIFQISDSFYFKLQAAGRLTRFEADGSVLGVTRYCGATVRAFVLNEGRGARVFGAKRGPRAVKVNRVAMFHDAAQSAASTPAAASEQMSQERA